MKKKTENKKGNISSKSINGIIIVLGVAFFIGSIVLVLALMGVFRDNKNSEEDVTRYEMTSSVFTQAITESDVDGQNVASDTFDSSTTSGGGGDVRPSNGVAVKPNSSVNNSKPTTPDTTKSAAIEYYEQLSPKGDNMLSDNCENEFIKLVSENYNIDSDLLVAIYSIPDNGDNFVLEFNGKKDKNGNYIKSPATLRRIYQIDKSKNIKIATGKTTGNVGVSYGEGILCFNMIKTVVMEQYPDYFTGLKGK